MQKLTIARLAKGAGVGVETVRYYQRRGLMPVPKAWGDSAYRTYDEEHVQRLRIIRRAQAAGFTLEEIGELPEADPLADVSATRDAEARVRFLGYDPANTKLIAFVVAAVMASIGGALFTPIVGIISPSNVDAAASIMLLAGVALGGRSTLLGPAVGAIAVGYGQSTLSESYPTTWTYFQGALFIIVMLLLPGGLAALWTKLKGLVASRSTSDRVAVETKAAVGAEAVACPPRSSVRTTSRSGT